MNIATGDERWMPELNAECWLLSAYSRLTLPFPSASLLGLLE
jgi:hypothetical protein